MAVTKRMRSPVPRATPSTRRRMAANNGRISAVSSVERVSSVKGASEQWTTYGKRWNASMPAPSAC